VKRLIVCCDGTWNRPDHVDRGVAAPTNVAKVALALADEDDDRNPQLMHYQAGVGTRRHEHLLGGGLGVGLSRNIKECYRFIVENYEPGDELYFFGFSRGAFTARSTVGLVRNGGVLRPGHRERIEEAYSLYRNPDKDSAPSGIAAELFRRTHSYSDVYIQFVGVWDTVGALGIPIDGFRPPVLSNLWTFHDTTLSRYVRHAYHAVAIDERRRPFEPTLWELKEGDIRPRDFSLEQVWFAGVHCDIGGGYSDPSLSELPLLWIAAKARECGLAFEPDRLVVKHKNEVDEALRPSGIQVAPDPSGTKRESRTRFYLLQPPYDRRLSGRDGKAVEGGSLASSARTRYERDATYRPPGLSEWRGTVTAVQEGP
jgi:uncharacterized protein (DUF2235 family)